MYKERNHIKVFVSSTVYVFESQLDMVYSTLDGYGYDVMMSHKGTIPLDSKLSNLENCLKGVEDCDVFLGFVRPLTGTGILKPGEKSITAQEFEVAFKVNMPRFVLADYRVVFARQCTNLMRIPTGDIPNSVKRERSDGSIVERPNRVVHTECIELYNAAIQNRGYQPWNNARVSDKEKECLGGRTKLTIYRTPNVVRLNARVTEYVATKKVECSFSKQDYLQYWNYKISNPTAKNDLQQMVNAHLCRKDGSGPATRYVVLANN